MPQLYYLYEDELCEKAYLIEHMKENDLTEIEVYKAKRVTGKAHFFCKKLSLVCERGVDSPCGINWCEYYKPNNGKSGRCKHYGYCYEPTDKVVLKIK